ncbi:outer membrane beta-barrel protein [Algoriphagus aestuarii]|nr:outer membrane beta-barrel protein [Algoriphagus aestuarii]
MIVNHFVALALIYLFVGVSCCFSQSISGRIIDEKGSPVDGIVYLTPNQDSTEILKVEVTDVDGKFAFNELDLGIYEVYFSLFGTKSKFPEKVILSAESPNYELADFVVKGQALEMEEFVLIETKPLVEQKIDRTVVNVEAILSNQGLTALDALEKSPGLRVDDNGSISLKGRPGVTVYIDDKPTYLSGADLAAYLSSLSSATLESIEIMTNPPARYDAAGNGGVINIKTKRKNVVGFNLGFNLSLIQHQYTETRNSLNFNFRKNKINVYGNFGYGIRNGFVNFYVDRSFLDENGNILTNFDQYSFIRRKGYQFTSTLGVDFYQSDNTTWGIVLGGISRHPKSTTDSTIDFTDLFGAVDSTTLTSNSELEKFINGSINFNLRHDFKKKGSNFGLDLDHIVYETGNKQKFEDLTYGANEDLLSRDQLFGDLKSDLKISSAKADYTNPLNTSTVLSFGAKTSFTQTDNSAEYFNIVGLDSIPDYDKTNQFLYDETIGAAYINLSKEYNRLSLQAGLRFEGTVSKGHQLGNATKPDSVFRRKYDGLFPTFFALYKIDTMSNHQIRVNYGRRIDRPYFQDLNPFITPLNKYTFYVGNPLLLPSFSRKIEMSYIFKGSTTATVGYSYSKDQVNETIEIDDEIYYSRPGNIGSTKLVNLSVDGNYDISDNIRFQFFGSLDFVNIKSEFYEGPLEHKGINGYFQGLFSFEFGQDWNIQVDGNYRSKVTNAQFLYGSKGALNFGISKKISERSYLSLTGSDLLYTNINQGEIRNLNQSEARYTNLGDTRRVLLTFRLNLGKEFAKKERQKSSGADDEVNRVKN